MNLLKSAILASLEAGKIIMDVYSSTFDVEYKDDASPLTIADKKANDVIARHLQQLDIPLISEENKQTDYQIRKNWSRCWIVDPLDGTKEFIKRNGEFTVNIALVEKGRPILGVIYIPDSKILYYADVVTGKAYKAHLNKHLTAFDDITAMAEEIGPSKHSSAVRIVGSRSHLSPETEDFINSIKKEETVELVSRGSSLKFCLVAEGNADIYPRYAPTMEWDTAAGRAICNAVGVTVNALPSHKPMEYNKENLLNPWFMVSNRK